MQRRDLGGRVPVAPARNSSHRDRGAFAKKVKRLAKKHGVSAEHGYVPIFGYGEWQSLLYSPRAQEPRMNRPAAEHSVLTSSGSDMSCGATYTQARDA